jgi:Predicted ATPase (AAA+ superfamily)
MIQRAEYLNKLISFKDSELIKVVTGIRRSGKSTLLKLYIDYLRSTGVPQKRIILLNFEDFENAELADPKILHKYIVEKTASNRKYYVFLDEIQVVPNFEKVVNSLNLRKNIDLYITGSNAYFLSGELATFMAGRYISIEITPLSFKEYCSAFKNIPREKLFENYINFSSFPYALELGLDREKINDYLAAILNTIILKDVVQRKKISDVSVLERLIKFIFGNIGFLTSTKKISDTLKTFGLKISVQTVENYLSALQESYIIYKVNRLDVNGREYLKANDKYFVADLGIRRYLLGDKRKDYGSILENVVYLELIRRGYEVFVGRLGNLEIDFIAFKNGIPSYYQVAYTVRDKSTFERELAPLEKIKNNYEKFIITMDSGSSNDNGIKTINALDFLLA